MTTRPSREKGLHRLFDAAVFLAAFSVTAVLVVREAGYPELGPLKEKLLYFEAHKDAYDVVFVGSSRVLRGVVPPRFDAEMAARGFPVRSFNLAVAGMEPHEANAVVRRVLAMEPAGLRWAVVELGDWDPVIRPENRFKRRAIFWHDASETVSVLRTSVLLDEPVAARADLVLTHVLHFAARSLAVGRGPDAARAIFGGEPAAAGPGLVRWQGFEPYTETSYRFNPLRRRFLERLDEYRAAVRRLADGDETAASPEPYDTAALRAQVDMIRRAGVEPVHLIPPAPRATPGLERLAREEGAAALLAFNRPRDYPQLFAVESRFDREHLTQVAAEELTRLLAARFAAEIVRRTPPVTERVAEMQPASGGE